MAAQSSFRELNLAITGIASQYPPYALGTDALDILRKRFYPDSPAYVFDS